MIASVILGVYLYIALIRKRKVRETDARQSNEISRQVRYMRNEIKARSA